MRKYELVLVVRPTVKEADAKKLFTTIKDWMKEVKVVKEDDWGQKPLAYPIAKENAGHYYQWFLETEEEISVPKDLEQRIFRNDSVIRHLLIRTK